MIAPQALDVLVVGDLFLDLIMTGFGDLPRPGEEAFATGFGREVGGGAAITAAGLAKLGMKVGVLGFVGEEDGEWIIRRLRNLGLNVSTIFQSRHEPTAITVSISGKSERSFLTYMGANRELHSFFRSEECNHRFLGAKHIHFACAPDSTVFRHLLINLGSNGVTSSVDVGWHPDWLADSSSINALREASIFFPNEREAQQITGKSSPVEMLDEFRKKEFNTVALKLGMGGALLLEGEEIFSEASVKMDVADTTGAGDSFDAGFLFARLQEMDSQTCLRAGVACGSLSTRALGGIQGFPTLHELETILCNAK